MQTVRKVRIGEDVSAWAEPLRETALQIPPSWRERAEKKLERAGHSVAVDTPAVVAALAVFVASYAKKAERMRVVSQRRQFARYANKLLDTYLNEDAVNEDAVNEDAVKEDAVNEDAVKELPSLH